MKTLETPVSLSREPSKSEFHLPAYDWNKQSRNTPSNSLTYNSVQTFASNGQPCDAKSEYDDK
jgi:hypothetical protein